MIELLQLGKTHGYEKLREAVESALELGSCDVSTVQYLMTAGQLDRGPCGTDRCRPAELLRTAAAGHDRLRSTSCRSGGDAMSGTERED